MPLSFIHIAINIGIYYIISLIFPVEFTALNCVFLVCAEFIDLDHLLSKPIYKKNRSSFATHFFHKAWLYTMLFAIGLIILAQYIFHPIMYLGIGILSHLLVDYLYTKFWLKL